MNKKKAIFWIILGIVIVGIVLTILFITLFVHKTTKSLAENVNSYTTGEGYLNTTSERNQKVNEYFARTYTLYNGEDANEIENYKNVYAIYVDVANYFEKEIAFMKYNNTYKSKKVDVEKNLKEAQKKLDELIKNIEENKSTTFGNATLEKILWNDNKHLAKEFIEKTITAFNTLSDIYTESVVSTLLNNDYSKANFIVLKDLSGEILKNIKTENVSDRLDNFVSIKFVDAGETKIMNYVCFPNDSVITKIKNILKNGKTSEFYNDFVLGVF